VQKVKSLVVHPFLIAAFPILALLANNIDQIGPNAAWRALLFSLLGVTILFLLLRLILRDWHRAGALTTFFMLLFFTYGHLYQSIRGLELFGASIGRHRVLLPIWLIVIIVGTWLITKRLKRPRSVTMPLNIIVGAMLIVPVFQIVDFQIRSIRARSEALPATTMQNFDLPDDEPLPDIYYIILDAYARGDFLRENFGYDNTGFLNWLTENGFIVAEKSQSNYAQTKLSLASSLNMDYLQSLRSDIVNGNGDSLLLNPMITQSAVRSNLEGLGYKIVAFETGYNWTQIEDADFYLTKRTSKIGEFYAQGRMNGFEAMLLQNSMLLVATDAVIVLPDIFTPDIQAPFQDHRERILYILDSLKDAPSIQGPKFVFAHLVIPHPPFVFAPEGDEVVLPSQFTLAETTEIQDEASYITGYLNQVQFINVQMESVLSEILAKSDVPPVIVIQADHGPGLASMYGRMAILNAYFLPGKDESVIYEDISPINTFRVIFNEFFGAHYPLLEDISYFSTYQDLYDFHIVDE
jgi:hypothetical protein